MRRLIQLKIPVRLSDDPETIRSFHDDWNDALRVIVARRTKEYPATALTHDGIEVCGACGCLIFPGTTMIYQADSPPIHRNSTDCEIAHRQQRGDSRAD